MYKVSLYFYILLVTALESWSLLPVSRRISPPRRYLTLPQSGNNSNDADSMIRREEEEYEKKLAEAKEAVQAAETTRERVGELKRRQNPPILVGAKVSRSDAGTLIINLPPSGFDAQSALGGAFTIAWFSAIIPATLSGAGLFIIPFWVAGGLVAKQSLVDPFVGSELEIGKYAWSYGSKFAGRNIKKKEGATEDLLVARSEVAVVVNGKPQYALTLYGSNESTSFILPMTMAEEDVEYLTTIINDHLRNIRKEEDDDVWPPVRS